MKEEEALIRFDERLKLLTALTDKEADIRYDERQAVLNVIDEWLCLEAHSGLDLPDLIRKLRRGDL